MTSNGSDQYDNTSLLYTVTSPSMAYVAKVSPKAVTVLETVPAGQP